MSDTKRWVKVTRNAKGNVTVRVSLQRDGHSAAWTVGAFSTEEAMIVGVHEAQAGAEKALTAIEKAVAT